MMVNMKQNFTTREICKCCFRPVSVGFNVPDWVWHAVARGKFNVLCLQCFTTLADEMLIEWDKDIEFYPVSYRTFLDLKGELKND